MRLPTRHDDTSPQIEVNRDEYFRYVRKAEDQKPKAELLKFLLRSVVANQIFENREHVLAVAHDALKHGS